jgi:hypothetical protein
MGYEAGKIYKIVGSGLTYYGSTKDTLEVRLNTHKGCNNKCASNQIIDAGNYEMILVELYPCKSRAELETREGYYIKYNDCVNNYIAGRTLKEYCIDNADKIKQQHKQYAIDNADIIKERQKQYSADNANKLKQYRVDNADKIKQQKKKYIIDNADKIKEKAKQYYIDNADKIKEQKKQYYIKKKATLQSL